jgi:3'-phosphoadenosine 5'-phosphosulfate sulfotransferase (PAPS reductase)/FAD synthetase
MSHQIELFKTETVNVDFTNYTIIINISGGKDSTAMLYYLAAKYPQHKKVCLYNDTGFEHPGIWEYIQAITEPLNINVVKLDAPKGLFQLIRERKLLPADHCRYCTRALKMGPSEKWIRANLPRGKIVCCSGLRGEESTTRAKIPPLREYQAISTKDRHVLRFNPLHYWKEGHVKEFLYGQGVELFHTYDYLKRLSCRFCFLSGKKERAAIRMNDPDGFELVQELGESIGAKII